MRYIAQITDCGPLSFRKGREASASETYPYVPGTSCYGGLAAAHAKLRSNPDEFNALFMADGVAYGNLYPANCKQPDLMGWDNPVCPLPRTARSCKRFSGFKGDKIKPHDEVHGVSDALIAWALFALSGQTRTAPLEALKDCPVCGEPMDAFSGFYRRDRFDPQMIGSADVKLGLRTRTGISRATDAVKQGILYSRQILQAGSHFWGTWRVPDDQADTFYDFIEQASETGLLRFGNNRTRGFGRVTINLEKDEEDDDREELQLRIADFNAALQTQADAYDVALAHAVYVPLTLLSDVILPDPLLRYRKTIPAAYLADPWGLEGAELVYQCSDTRSVMSWNELWRLPKPDEVAVEKGAVLLFGFSDALDDAQLDTWLRMQTEGIGTRRAEGFGQVRVADSFHWEVKGL
jgi:CRISPR-associated protein Csx10